MGRGPGYGEANQVGNPAQAPAQTIAHGSRRRVAGNRTDAAARRRSSQSASDQAMKKRDAARARNTIADTLGISTATQRNWQSQQGPMNRAESGRYGSIGEAKFKKGVQRRRRAIAAGREKGPVKSVKRKKGGRRSR